MNEFPDLDDPEDLRVALAQYRTEHRTLDEDLRGLMTAAQPLNLFHVQQLKKKKLWLKDMIQRLESSLIDDIIA